MGEKDSVGTRTVNSNKINTASSNMQTSFNASCTASLILSGLKDVSGMAIISHVVGEIAVNYTSGNSVTAPSDVDAYIPAAAVGSFSTLVLDKCYPSACVYLRSDTGANLTSGLVRIFVW